jgi:hypothetical protein
MSFEVEVGGLEQVNSLFTKAYCKIGYAGKNRNGSFIKKEAYENSVDNLYYTPIVGEWIKDKENFGGHGGKLEITSKEVNYIDTTIPYGCVGANVDLNPRWELGKDGKEYYTVDIFLWTHKYPELSKLVTNGSWHSMEINVVNGFQAVIEKEEVFVIEKMEFTALCILGKDTENPINNVEPCFEDSEIRAYELNNNNFKEDFTLMIKELKYSLSNSTLSYDRWVNKILKSEVDSGMTTKIDNTELFSDQTTEEMCNSGKMEEMCNTGKMENTEGEDTEKMENADQSQEMCNTEKMEVEAEMCNTEKMEDGVTLETTMETETTATTETETEDTETDDTEVTDDTEETETESAKAAKAELYNQETFANLITDFETLKVTFSELQTSYNSIIEENLLLNEKINAKELVEKQNEIDLIFARFDNIFSEEDLKDIKSKAINMEISEIESQLFALYGQRMMKFNVQKSNSLIDLGIIPQTSTENKNEESDIFIKAKNEINK